MKQIKTIKALEKEILKREGKKKQVNAAQVSEIVGVISDILFSQVFMLNLDRDDAHSFAKGCLDSRSDFPTGEALIKNGAKRFLKRSKGKK